MGTHHGGNDGNVPPDGDRSPDPDLPELPELPPEWGEVAVPDDPSELAAEAEQIREELIREDQAGRTGGGGGAAAGTGAVEGAPSIGVPLLIMSVAVLITLVSLFAMAWSGTGSLPDQSNPGSGDGPAELPPMTLVDAAGRQVALTAQTPVVIMLVEECECGGLVSATVGAAPPGVRVAMVGHAPPAEPVGQALGDQAPLRLGDPAGLVRAELRLDPPTDTATVVLVDRDQRITLTQESATSVAQYQGDLTDLGS
ncbi:MAG: hypothetical protein GEV12_12265 [Micromonosporaceae bacterium]|nr:hypothetical protein [Micromonosporaceae bacterium]